MIVKIPCLTQGSNPGPVDKPVLNLLSYRGSSKMESSLKEKNFFLLATTFNTAGKVISILLVPDETTKYNLDKRKRKNMKHFNAVSLED